MASIKKSEDWLSLLIIIYLACIIKYIILNVNKAPPGADVGNWLFITHVLEGVDVEGYGLTYPPLLFILLSVLLKIFDPFTALKITGIVLSTIIGIPFYFIAKKLSNSYAALIVTLLLIFNEFHFEMLSWGAYPQFLGIFFLLSTTFFLLELLEKTSRKSILLELLSLNLLIGSHHFTFLYFAVVLIVFGLFLFIFKNKRFFALIKQITLVWHWVAFFIFICLPYLPIYLNIARLAHGSPLILPSFSLNSIINSIIQGFFFIFRDSLTKGLIIPYLPFLIILIFSIMGLINFIYSREEKFETKLFLSSYIIASLILSLFLPLQSYRALFFAVIFLLLFLSKTLTVEGLRLSLHIHIYRGKIDTVLKIKVQKIIILSFLMILVILTPIIGLERFIGARNFYQCIYDDEIEALNWIKQNTKPTDIIVTPTDGLRKWIKGYSSRSVLVGSDPLLSIYQHELKEVAIAKPILKANYVVGNNYVKAFDSFPNLGLNNPEIYANISGFLFPIIFFNDAFVKFAFSPTWNLSITWYEAPFWAREKTLLSLTSNYSDAKITCMFTWGNTTVIRTTSIRKGFPSVEVSYNFSLHDSLLRQLNIYIWGSQGTSFRNIRVNFTYAEIESELHYFYDKLIHTSIAIETNGIVLNVKHNIYGAMPYIIYSFNATENNFYVKFLVSIQDLNEVLFDYVEAYSIYELMKKHDISYIVMPTDDIYITKFYEDREHFKLVFKNGRIAIFLRQD
jgi:hypothetical protein